MPYARPLGEPCIEGGNTCVWWVIIVLESVVDGEGGSGLDHATKDFEEGFLLTLILGNIGVAFSGSQPTLCE